MIVLPQLLNEDECQELIQLGERNGFSEQQDQSLNAWSSIDVPMQNVHFLWDRVKNALSPIVDEHNVIWIPCSVNTRLRYSRYKQGQQSQVHTDVPFLASPTTRTFLTLLIYLNDSFEGGETCFFNPDSTIKPNTGSVIMFDHQHLHQGTAVVNGRKYIVRSDIIFSSDKIVTATTS
jgi:prolyl 4-hydroxylase